MTIPSIPLEKLVNKVLKILSGESSPLILSGLKNQLHQGKLMQGEIVKILPNNKATISIEGQKVVAELPDLDVKPQNNRRLVKTESAFKAGQKINVQVEKVNPEPVLKLVPAPEQKIQEEGYTTNLSRKIKPEIIKHDNFCQLKLPPEKIVPVKIDRIVNSNSLLVKFEGQEFQVKTENANLYRVGEKVRIQFQKIENGFKPVLLDQPAIPEKVNLDLIKPYLPSRRPLVQLVGELNRDVLGSQVLKELSIKPELIGILKETIQALTPKTGNIPNEVEIEEQVDKSGVRYEAKVRQFFSESESKNIKSDLTRDLKGQLLDLKQATEKAIKNSPELNQKRQVTEFQQRIKVSLDSIELNQLSSRVSTQENQPLVLQIPNPLNPNEKTISLFFRGESEDGNEGGKAKKEIYNLAFFLDLSELGNVKINAQVGPENLAVRMDVEQNNIAKYILENTEEFESRMKDNEMNATVECFVEEKVSPIKDNLIELFVSQNTSLLSVKT
ncbi:MAG: hypothetical protein VW455_05545 [Nitrospinota bacterium]